MKFYKELLFFSILLIVIQIILSFMDYPKAPILTVIAVFLALIAYILVVRDLHSMKGLHPKERFFLSLLLFLSNILGLLIYLKYSSYLKERSERTLQNKEDRWHSLIQQIKDSTEK